MTYEQLVTPDPNIPTKPGWCLQYVRQAFGAPVVEPTATAGWFNADYRHTDTDMPAGCWVPVWFELDTEPAGHVALLAPDGSVYSTTSPYGDRATHHPTLAHLYAAYAPYNPLTWRGWSEDISGVRVVQETTLSYQSTTNTEGDPMSAQEVAEIKQFIQDAHDVTRGFITDIPGRVLDAPVQREGKGAGLGEQTSLRGVVAWFDTANLNIIGNSADAGAIADKIIAEFGETLAGDIVSAVGQRLATKVTG